MATQNLMLGDCMEWMRRLPDKYYDLAICDPPYGINVAKSGKVGCNNCGTAKNYGAKEWDNEAPKNEYFSQLRRVSKNQIVWGANHFISRMPFDSSCWIVWDKNNTAYFADCELAWTSFDLAVRKFKHTWNGMIQGDMKNKQERFHPTEKPIALYKWLLTNYAKEGQKIFDSYGGSFSHAIAAYDLGFDLDIIEIDPDYFRDGKARYDAHVTKCEEIKHLGFAKTELSKTNPTLF